MGELKEILYLIKEIIATNPKTAKYIFIICLIIVIWKIIVIVIEKCMPDLPYKHSKEISNNTNAINEHSKIINELCKSIVRIESKLDTLISKKGKNEKNS